MDHNHYCNANSSSDSQETPYILWNPEVHRRVHNSLPTNPTQSQINQLPILLLI
jgi:hypothetical protein